MEKLKLAAALVGTLVFSGAISNLTPLAIAAQRSVLVEISHVKAIDNMDGDFPHVDRADFYAVLFIEDQRMRTPTEFGKDDLWPSWNLILPISTAEPKTRLRLRIMDDDSGLAGASDDWCDINPLSKERDLNIIYEWATGRVTGDVSGMREVPITVKGEGDAKRALLTFTVKDW